MLRKNKFRELNKRISDLQVEMRELRRGYQNLLDERANTAKEIKQIFTSELATYRSAVQATQTDRIKFGVLEEWINDVFKLNGLKFSEQDFIDKSQESILREKIVNELKNSVKSAGVNVEELAEILIKAIDK